MKRIEFTKSRLVGYGEFGARLYIDKDAIELTLWLCHWWLSWELTSLQEEGAEGKEKEPG